MSPAFVIETVRGKSSIAAITQLFTDYQAAIGVDLCFQDFANELADLPGAYQPPEGELLLARDGQGKAIGCVALKPLEMAGLCEMKRLFVRSEARGLGLGRELIERIIECARGIGYDEMRLDSLPTMARAVELYVEYGFRPIKPYYQSPIAGTHFMGLKLNP